MEGVLPLLARLPRRPEARRELGLHVAREAIWAVLFAGLAWFAWHGAAAWIIAGLLAAEIAITACDEFIENRIRVLPQNERVVLPTALAPPRLRPALMADQRRRCGRGILVAARSFRMAAATPC